MSITIKKNTTYLSAAGTAFAVTLAMSPTASANASSSANPFMVADLGNGYMVAEAAEGKGGEGQCAGKSSEKKAGEGNCAAEKGKEGDCSAKKDKEGDKAGEGKCGEGKCANT